ncbi:MAG TPA: anthranilate synthase component I family protein [Candidatus Thermoplasmatota archaeon]|nr:anthranilate synthase component I family protein [Candidatus Thermoplasmatota archaeon]
MAAAATLQQLPPAVAVELPRADAWRLFLPFARTRGAVLLESGGAREGWSFVAARPAAEFVAAAERWTLRSAAGTRTGSDPWGALARELAARRRRAAPGLPPFQGGAVGMVSYDAGRLLERLPSRASDDLGLPWLHLFFFDEALAVEHATGRALALAAPRASESPSQALARARALASEAAKAPSFYDPKSVGASEVAARSNLPRGGFEDMVLRAKERICDGEVFQVNLSQRFEAPCADALSAYARSREANPSPMMAYQEFGAYRLASNSPERLLSVRGPRVATRPIAGTRPRGATPADDERLAAELAANEKELAEHVMLVDLARNDLGRACRFGSVRVREFLALERYSHVTHLVSEVEGELAPGQSALTALAAAFPGGTITGCPKVRCMEIVDELEPVRRGPYTGSLGYLSDTGDADFNILIRTLVETRGRGFVQAGAGVVADSDPVREREETEHKARAMLAALGARIP